MNGGGKGGAQGGVGEWGWEGGKRVGWVNGGGKGGEKGGVSERGLEGGGVVSASFIIYFHHGYIVMKEIRIR